MAEVYLFFCTSLACLLAFTPLLVDCRKTKKNKQRTQSEPKLIQATSVPTKTDATNVTDANQTPKRTVPTQAQESPSPAAIPRPAEGPKASDGQKVPDVQKAPVVAGMTSTHADQNCVGADKKQVEGSAKPEAPKASKRSGGRKDQEPHEKTASRKSSKKHRSKVDKDKSPVSKLAVQPAVIEEEFVIKMGNLDTEMKNKKAKLVEEIDKMTSEHDYDKHPNKDKPAVDARVIVNEKKCKLYETDNVETKDSEADQNLI